MSVKTTIEKEIRIAARAAQKQRSAEIKQKVKDFMAAHPNTLIKYVRKNNDVVGTVVAISSDQIGWSRRRKTDKHSKYEALWEAIQKIGIEPCYSMIKYVGEMKDRANKYFQQTILVEVTEEDIKNGEQGAATSCPIALATKRILGPHISCAVDDTSISLRDANTLECYEVYSTAEMSYFVREFDNGDEVSPFSFPAKIPQRFLKDKSCEVEIG